MNINDAPPKGFYATRDGKDIWRETCPNCAAEYVIERASPWDHLGSAWAEAVMALPEGWEILDLTRVNDLSHCCSYCYAERTWTAMAGKVPANMDAEEVTGAEYATGPTPAAALRALASKLRDRA